MQKKKKKKKGPVKHRWDSHSFLQKGSWDSGRKCSMIFLGHEVMEEGSKQRRQQEKNHEAGEDAVTWSCETSPHEGIVGFLNFVKD